MHFKKKVNNILTLFFLLILTNQIFSQLDFTSSNIPIIIIETNELEILDEPRITANMKVINNLERRNYISESYYEYFGKISIELRGSTSQFFPKKQYGLETQNQDGSNNNVSLLGMPSENDWILSAPYSDKTLIRNIISYKLFESLGNYAPRTRVCELVLNGEYMGVYVLTEKIKRDINRVSISELNTDENFGDNLTGGYIVKIDKSIGNTCFSWSTDIAGINIEYEYPKCDNITFEQREYIKNYIDNFEQSLFNNEFSDTLYGYNQFIDVNSFLDYFIINEISKNIDAYGLSTFIYKDRDSNNGKLNFGPVWDYNIAYGNAYYKDGYKTDEIIATDHEWWNRLLQDTTFKNLLKRRWDKFRKNQLSNDKILNLIDSLVYVLDESKERNFQKWDILEKQIWPNYYVGKSYENEINFLKSWIINRINWLDNNIPGSFNDYTPFLDYESSIFPNPYDYFFTFTFNLEKRSNIKISLFDSNGNWITNIINDSYYDEGKHKVTYNSLINPNIVPSTASIFKFIVLEVNNEIVLQKMILNKF